MVGRYALYGALAQGGMATVHLGCLRGPVGFSRIVAIKRMLPQYAANPDFVAMFLEEARLAGRVRHPNVVPVIDVVAEDGEVLLVMEYVRGEAVSRIGRDIPGPIACAIACDMLDGLHAAHEALDDDGHPLGIVHRDVSPQNVIVGVDGIARVLDFGIAKAVGRAQVTREGQLKGKLAYMAPEQLKGNATRTSDIYSAGVVVWEMLAGKRLFDRESEGQTMHAILHDTISAPGTPYDAVVLRALARDPNDRFPTARDFALVLAKSAERAEAHEVGVWLETRAKESLAARHELVSEIETAVTEQDPDPKKQPTRKLWPLFAGGAALVLAGAGATWLLTRPPPPAATPTFVPAPSIVPIASTAPPAASVENVPSATAVVPQPSVVHTAPKHVPTASASASVRIPEFL